jgi:hypothetical protein
MSVLLLFGIFITVIIYSVILILVSFELHQNVFRAILPLPIALIFLFVGGFAILQHYILMFTLKLSGSLPWQLEKFLFEAKNCHFSVENQGRYSFKHKYLQEYFKKTKD